MVNDRCPKGVFFIEIETQVRLNKWKYVNNLMDHLDGFSSPDMENVLCHSRLLELAIGNRMHTCSHAAREVEG